MRYTSQYTQDSQTWVREERLCITAFGKDNQCGFWLTNKSQHHNIARDLNVQALRLFLVYGGTWEIPKAVPEGGGLGTKTLDLLKPLMDKWKKQNKPLGSTLFAWLSHLISKKLPWFLKTLLWLVSGARPRPSGT